MDQATLADDELYAEATADLREDIEAALGGAEAALPDAEAIWTPEGDNLLGQLNALRSTLDANPAREHLREAKKHLLLATRAEALEADDDLAQRIEELEGALEDIDDVKASVDTLAATLPELRTTLE